MSKNRRKMIFVLAVGITIQIIWLILFPKLSHTDYFYYYTTLMNIGMLLPIIVQIVSAKMTSYATLLSILLAIICYPAVWLLLGFKIPVNLLYDTLYFRYTPFGLTATFFSCQLIEAFYNRKCTNTDTSLSTLCPHCSTPLSLNQLFCNNCHTMSHKAKDVFIKFPKKHYLDFAEQKNNGYRHCPHCGKVTIRTFGIIPCMGIPLRVCGNCHNIYISTLYCEWSMASITDKIIICIFDGPHLLLFALLLFGIFNQSLPISFGLISLAAIVFLRVLWFFTITIFDIRESEARLNANPEYPYLLIKMGYQRFTEDYRNLHNH